MNRLCISAFLCLLLTATGITEVQVSGGPGEEDILSDLPEAKERMHFAESAGELGIKG